MDSGQDVLKVDHDGRVYTAAPGTILTFGRGSACEVRIGADDPTVHRRVGSFHWKGGHWQVHNDGSRCALDVAIEGGIAARIAAGADPLSLPHSAHGTLHILTLHPLSLSFATPQALEQAEAEVPVSDDIDGATTMGMREMLGLSSQELQMLVALCEPRLRDPRLQSFEVPSTSAVCSRLGISKKRAEDLVDSLSMKLASHVGGVIGSNDGRAVTRRHRIAAFALDTRCVTVSDLRHLPVEPAPLAENR
jgi:hypothetical protein